MVLAESPAGETVNPRVYKTKAENIAANFIKREVQWKK